jgi:hypothetical protein
MAWVPVNGHCSHRRPLRVGDRVFTECIGGGWIGRLAAEYDARREPRQWGGWEERLDLDLVLAAFKTAGGGRGGRAPVHHAGRAVRDVLPPPAVEVGTRGEVIATKTTNGATGTLAALSAPAVPPLLPLGAEQATALEEVAATRW